MKLLQLFIIFTNNSNIPQNKLETDGNHVLNENFQNWETNISNIFWKSNKTPSLKTICNWNK